MIAIIATGVVCLVLARAIVHKATAYAGFKAAVFDYRIAPEKWAGALSVALLLVEVAALWTIALPPVRVAGAVLAAGLFATYAAAMAFNLLRGRERIDCGCGGAGQALSWWLVLRNLLLIGICTLVALPGEPPALSVTATAAAAGCSIVLWLSLVLFDQLHANRSHAQATSSAGSY
jgi:hypothetical protein